MNFNLILTQPHRVKTNEPGAVFFVLYRYTVRLSK